MIRKSVFQKLKGFRHVPRTAMEDWEFLGELALEGFSLDVVPAPLFAYRHHASSNIRRSSYYDSHRRTLEPYLKRMEPWQRRMLINCVGAYNVKATAALATATPVENAEVEAVAALSSDTAPCSPTESVEAAPPADTVPEVDAAGETAALEIAPGGELVDIAPVLSWQRMLSYRQYDAAYQVWKNYRNRVIDKNEALRSIGDQYGIGPFFLLFPLYKFIKPLVKLKSYLA
jgi:hypothetical protein